MIKPNVIPFNEPNSEWPFTKTQGRLAVKKMLNVAKLKSKGKNKFIRIVLTI